MICAGCQRALEVGDRYISFTASEWAEREGKSFEGLEELNDVFASIMGSEFGDEMVFCEDCTEDSEDGWKSSMVYGDEDE